MHYPSLYYYIVDLLEGDPDDKYLGMFDQVGVPTFLTSPDVSRSALAEKALVESQVGNSTPAVPSSDADSSASAASDDPAPTTSTDDSSDHTMNTDPSMDAPTALDS